MIVFRSRQARSAWSRFTLSGDKKELDSAIAHQQAALDLCSHDSDDRATALFVLAYFLGERYERWGDVSDLENALTMNRASLDLRPDDHPRRSESLNDTANCLLMLYGREGKLEVLEEAISLHRAALELRPEGHPDRSASLNNIANCLNKRYDLEGKLEDLEESISLHRTALGLTSDSHSNRSTLLNNTANGLLTRYEREGRMSDLEEAISLYRTTLKSHPDGHPAKLVALNNTAICLQRRYQREGRIEDLEEAIALDRSALDLIPDGHPDRAKLLNTTANCLSIRYEHGGRMKDLEEAISLHRAALELRPVGHPERPSSLNNAASCLSARYEREGRLEDLEEAIALHRAGLELRPPGHPSRSSSLNNTANCVLTRYERDGRMSDLEEAIALHRAALESRQDGSPGQSTSLNNTANCLLRRYDREQRAEDLDEAIALYRAALDLHPEGHPDRSASLDNTANCLETRYEREGKMSDLEEVISLRRAALILRPDGHPSRSTSLNNTAISLWNFYVREGKLEILEEAIALSRAALDLRPEGHPERSASLNNTANYLGMRYEQEGRMVDLEEAISLHRAALDLRPDGHPDRSSSLNNVASCLLRRYAREGKLEHLEEAIQSLRAASLHAFSTFPLRFRAVRRWVETARSHDHESLPEAYKAAMSILQRALTTRPTLSAQHKFLSDDSYYQTLALDAAASAIDKGEVHQAVEFLEQGRGLLWSQMRGFRTPLERLSQENRSLAERFEGCNRRLQALITSSESPVAKSEMEGNGSQAFSVSLEKNSIDRLLVRMRQLHEEQESIIDEIRSLNGFEDFLRATPFGRLKQAASEGPVVVLNHSRFRCDALIITSLENTQCACVPLDRDFYADTVRLHEELLQIRKKYKVDSHEYDEVLRRAMKVLWDRVVVKIVEKLKELGIVEESRIWWCPTSVLTAFPFHAAGPYEDPDGNARYLLDDYVPSYTPTLTSLINSRSGRSNKKGRMLFVADTKLFSAVRERDAIRRVRRVNCQLLDEDATPDSVIRELQRLPWVHFVCHGKLDEEPFNSSLRLPGGQLTLLDIARANLPDAEFAFLSACHTAEQGPRYALDEALHLAAAMQFCGFRSVVGTMWQLLDRDGPFLSGSVYAYLRYSVQEGEIGFKQAAAAVRAAGLRLRERVNEEVTGDEGNVMTERWVNLVHIGA